MNRREFIALAGGAAAMWPAATWGQQSGVPLVGYLMSRSAADAAHLAEAFRLGLRDGGYIAGENVNVEFRWADGQYERLPAMAREFVGLPVNVLVAVGGAPSAAAALAATSTIPIVFAMSGDPIAMGLAKSFNRPGGNATGVSILNTQIASKRLGLMHDLMPGVATIGALVDTSFSSSKSQVSDLQAAAPQAGLGIRIYGVATDSDIDTAFESISKDGITAIVIASSPYFDARTRKIAALAESHRVASIYPFRDDAVAGGLMSYGIDIAAMHRQTGLYTAQILKGAKPGDLPIVLPTKFEFVLNLKAAKNINLNIPAMLLARADEVIE